MAEKNEELEKIKAEKMKKFLNEKENPEKIIQVNDSNFEEMVLEKSKTVPVLVDFWAPWCAPCLMLGPVLEKVANNDGRFVLAKVNLNEARQSAEKYGVMSIPNVKLFKNGEVVDEFIGAISEEMIKQFLDKNLG